MPTYGRVKVDTITYDLSGTATDVSVSNIATKASPTFTGTVTVPTPTAGDNSTKAASTAFVATSFAPLASPTFTGSPTVPGYAALAGATFTGTVNGTSLVLSADLTVNGTTTTINTTTLQVEDKNIEIGKVSTPSDATADGGGLTLLGATNKTWNWVNSTDAWTSSEHIHLLDNKKLIVGTGGSDLTISHDGTNSLIDNNTGNLNIQSGGTIYLTNAAGNEVYAQFSENGAASLRYDNTTRLATTSSGCTVTGTLAATAVTGDGSGLTNLPPGGNTVDLVADGAIAAGKAVIVKSNGKVEQVKLVLTERSNYDRSEQMVGANNSYYSRSGFIKDITTPNGNAGSGDNQYVLAAYIQGSTDKVYTALGYFYSGGTAMSWTSYQVLINSNGNTNLACCGADKRWVVIAGEDQSNNGYISSYVIQVGDSNNPIAGSSGTMWTNTAQKQVDVCYDNTNDRVICVWKDSSGNGYYNVGTVNASALTINWGSVTQFVTGGIVASGQRQGLRVFWDDTIDRCIICYRRQDSNYSGGNAIVVRVCTIDATNQNLTVGAEQITTSTANLPRWGQGNGTVAALYQKTSANYQQRYKVGTINASAKTVTWGTEGNGPQSTYNNQENYYLAYNEDFNKYIAISSAGSSVSNTTHIYKGTLSGTAITWATNSTSIDSRRYDNGSFVYYRGSSIGNMGFSATDTMGTGSSGGSDDRVKLMNIYTGTSGSNLHNGHTNCVGFAEDAISDGNTGTIKTYGNVVGNQSGLSAGSTYYVKNDGTLDSGGHQSLYGGLALSSSTLLIQRKMV